MPPRKPPVQIDLEDLLEEPRKSSEGDDAVPSAPKPQSTASASPAPPPPEPTLTLSPEAFDDLASPSAAFSDAPPEGWGAGLGNVALEAPVANPAGPADPYLEAARSLRADAAREAAGRLRTPSRVPPTVAVPAKAVASAEPTVKDALARAAEAPDAARYRSRISISSAYQYDGRLATAPPFIDRNWMAWAEGPALDIPEVGVVRAGQWIVVQRVVSDDGSAEFEELKVYPDAVFRALFVVEAAGA